MVFPGRSVVTPYARMEAHPGSGVLLEWGPLPGSGSRSSLKSESENSHKLTKAKLLLYCRFPWHVALESMGPKRKRRADEAPVDVEGAAGEPPEDVDPDGVGPPAPRGGKKKMARLEIDQTLRELSESGFVESTLLSWGFNRRKCEAAGDCWAIATIAPAHIKPDKLISLTPKQRECAASSPPVHPDAQTFAPARPSRAAARLAVERACAHRRRQDPGRR